MIDMQPVVRAYIYQDRFKFQLLSQVISNIIKIDHLNGVILRDKGIRFKICKTYLKQKFFSENNFDWSEKLQRKIIEKFWGGN